MVTRQNPHDSIPELDLRFDSHEKLVNTVDLKVQDLGYIISSL